MWIKFTELARRSILLAQEEAAQNDGEICVAHLLLGVLRCEGKNAASGAHDAISQDAHSAPQNLVSQLLQINGVSAARLESQLMQFMEGNASKKNAEPQLTRDAKRVLDLSTAEARRVGHSYIGPEHLLLAMTCFDNHVRGLMYEHDLDAEKLRRQLSSLTGAAPPSYSGKAVLSETLRALLAESQRQASLVGNGRVGTGHLLLAIIHNGETRPNDAVIRLLQGYGIGLSEMRQRIRSRLTSDNEVGGIKPKPTKAARRVLELAYLEAEARYERFVKCEHLLLALSLPQRNHWRDLMEKWRGIASDEIACEVLSYYDLNAEVLRDALHNVEKPRASTQDSTDKKPEHIVVLENSVQYDVEIDWERENAM